ncbi:MAG: HAMP domain-containing histidine kinase [Oscillospiraceae bacterium]|nr:HAMP domain-containing histidine kinase [Oscillospiraceae bacterium]MCI9308331.1 HAMP domain-containing histidine kinase [Oscillospiraceae bacterium]
MMASRQRERESRVPFFHSIQAKYALTYLLVVAAILIVMNTYPVLMAQNMVFTSKESTLKRQALVIGSTLAVSETLTREGVEQTMALLEEAQGARVLVTDAAGLILYDSSTLDNRLGGYALTGEVAAALRGKDASRSEYREGAIRTRAAVPVMYHGMTLGAVYLYEYDTEQAQVLLSILSNLRYISIVVCVVALGLVVLLSKTLTRNTVRLLSAIRHVREGEYSHRVESLGKDEMAQLADEFNQLTGRLQTTEEARRRFVSDASHELKTPLASIRLLTDSILQNDPVDMATVREFVSDIGEEAERLTRISEHLLALTRLDAGEERSPEPVELGRVADKVVHLLSPVAQRAQVELKCDLEPACALLATEDDIYQVAFNLVENAIKYNLPGGRVEVGVRRRGDKVALTVTDTGLGIPQDDLPRIFDRFYRVDKARSRGLGGTGLGLSIARDTARVHGGDITAGPNPAGRGTRFEAEFPALKGGEGA